MIAVSTQRLTGGLVDYRDMGLATVKRIGEALRVWQVLGPSRVESRFEALHATTLTPIVGRDEEIELFLRRWQRAKNGEGQVVVPGSIAPRYGPCHDGHAAESRPCSYCVIHRRVLLLRRPQEIHASMQPGNQFRD